MKKEFWIVGKIISEEDNGFVWDFSGLYDNEKKAAEACLSDDYFIGRAAINSAIPDSRKKWPGAYYPRLA